MIFINMNRGTPWISCCGWTISPFGCKLGWKASILLISLNEKKWNKGWNSRDKLPNPLHTQPDPVPLSFLRPHSSEKKDELELSEWEWMISEAVGWVHATWSWGSGGSPSSGFSSFSWLSMVHFLIISEAYPSIQRGGESGLPLCARSSRLSPGLFLHWFTRLRLGWGGWNWKRSLSLRSRYFIPLPESFTEPFFSFFH